MKETYQFQTTCVSSTAELIDAMTERSREIKYKTALNLLGAEVLKEFNIYNWGRGKKKGLKLKNDWAVSYYKSKYNGRKCVYIVHSAIEHIFTLI